MKSFNLNHYVYIRLTKLGRDHVATDPVWQYNKVDDEGWTRVQLWEVMASFGDLLGNGRPVPFETYIRIAEKDLEDL